MYIHTLLYVHTSTLELSMVGMIHTYGNWNYSVNKLTINLVMYVHIRTCAQFLIGDMFLVSCLYVLYTYIHT